MHLSRNNWFTSNSFCCRLVFVASRGIIPFTIIWRCFNRFWKSSAIQISPSDISSGLSVSRLFVPQFITTYLSDCGRGILFDLHSTFWVLSPPIPQFTVSLQKFSSRYFYISLSLQQWSLLWQQSMYCFLLSGVLHVYYVYSATRFCKIFQLTVFFVSHQSSTTKTPFTHFISLQKSVLFFLCMLNWHCRFTSALEESVPSLTHCCCL